MEDDPATETIGQRIRRLRLERKLSQRELAEPGISYAYLSRIEAGQRVPSIKALRVLAKKLGVTPDYIETGAPIPEAAERELRLSDAELEVRLDRDLERAAAVFAEEATRDDEPALHARARAGLGLLASSRGDNAEAIRHLEAATRSGYFPPETRPDLYRALGVAYASSGAPTHAVNLFESCLTELRERLPQEGTLHVRYSVYLASAYAAFGNLARARAVLDEASEIAEGVAADPHVRINLYWALARDAWMQNDSEGALTHIRRAIGLLESSEDTYNLALAHLLAAQMMSLDGRGDEADRHLEQAERLLVLRGDNSDLGVLRAEQAKRAAATGRGDDALALANEAARLLADEGRFVGLKLHTLAAAHAAAGASEEAERYYSEALDALSEARQWRDAGHTAREWAHLLRSQGRTEEAFELMDKATVFTIRQRGEGAGGRTPEPR